MKKVFLFILMFSLTFIGCNKTKNSKDSDNSVAESLNELAQAIEDEDCDEIQDLIKEIKGQKLSKKQSKRLNELQEAATDVCGNMRGGQYNYSIDDDYSIDDYDDYNGDYEELSYNNIDVDNVITRLERAVNSNDCDRVNDIFEEFENIDEDDLTTSQALRLGEIVSKILELDCW